MIVLRRPTRVAAKGDVWTALAVLSFLLLAPWQLAQAEEQAAASLWDDFNHFVLIARPDLAEAAATALLDRADDTTLLDVVESSQYTEYEQNLLRAARIESLSATAAKVTQRIQQARIQRSREPARIRRDIEALAKGRRANMNATQRLRAAGQYAAPHLLATLLDEDQVSLHPYVLSAMVSVGRPIVYPLSTALPQLEPVPMGQIAQTLGEIGYPMALPYLKMVLESSSTDPTAAAAVGVAYNQLIQSVGMESDTLATDLFLSLALDQYNAGTHGDELPGFDRDTGKGQVWIYAGDAGLVPIPVSGVIFGDVLAMRSSQQALEINPAMDPAFSLWLAANLRRENRLPDSETDLSYPENLQPPTFYAKLAGYFRLHDVLALALLDHDPDLAIDAIQVLHDTVNADGLIHEPGGNQPLVAALGYPDRRVRYEAAFALAKSRPDAEFTSSHRVVPILAEAVGQQIIRYVLVIADDNQTVNSLQASLKDLGYETIGAVSLSQAAEQLDSYPDLDLIVTRLSASGIEQLYDRTSEDQRLALVPIVTLVSQDDQIELDKQIHEMPRLYPTQAMGDPDTLRPVLEQAAYAYAGPLIDDASAADYATTALMLLREVAFGGSKVFDISDAQPALIRALSDKRESISILAANVLGLIGNADAQQAIAHVVLDNALAKSARLAFLASLANSGTSHGNLLTDQQISRLRKLVSASDGDMALAAARAFGSLTVSTDQAVDLILR